jgi:hypothetical protein
MPDGLAAAAGYVGRLRTTCPCCVSRELAPGCTRAAGEKFAVVGDAIVVVGLICVGMVLGVMGGGRPEMKGE